MPSPITPAATTPPVRGMTGMLREFAALAILTRRRFAPATVAAVHDAIAQSLWHDVLPERYSHQTVHRALAGLETREHATHTGEHWQPTAAGLQFGRDHIDRNPNVNPEAREERGPGRMGRLR